MWIAISCALSATFSVLLAFLVARLAVRDAASSVRQARSLGSRIESLEASRDEQVQTLSDLANKIKMQRVRHAGLTHGERSTDRPDPYKDPDGWRKYMERSRLSGGKAMLGGE